ncbi:3135_t:CDS:2 [Diversispora eburnea]|uniref:3135_t:CDS:1 n=1 Tax=Diversispora eburnea TaxID=1213867 RepID=A0A9N9A5R8_9GLOM|nr:3135_t:CDS:2 [Diversispora eburnea]
MSDAENDNQNDQKNLEEGKSEEKEIEEEEPTETTDFADLPRMKKKKKKTMTEFIAQLNDGVEDATRTEDDVFATDGEHVDKETKLLGRVFHILRQNNPELAGEKRRYTIVPPAVHREGNKKTIFANVADICKRMHRQPEHVIQFLFAELGTSGSIDGAQRLIIKGRFQQKQLENVLRRYIGFKAQTEKRAAQRRAAAV